MDVVKNNNSIGRKAGLALLTAVAATPATALADNSNYLPDRTEYGVSGSLGVGFTTVSLPEDDIDSYYRRYRRDPGKEIEETVASGLAIIGEGNITLGKFYLNGKFNTVERGRSVSANYIAYEGENIELHARVGQQVAKILPHSNEVYTYGGVELRGGRTIPNRGTAELYAAANVQLDSESSGPQIQQLELGLVWNLKDNVTIKFTFKNEQVNTIPLAGTPANEVRNANVDKFADINVSTLEARIRF